LSTQSALGHRARRLRGTFGHLRQHLAR